MGPGAGTGIQLYPPWQMLMQSYFQDLMDRLFLRLRPPNRTKQVGALPYAIVDDRVAFLLVTSRRTGRWIYPKGSLIPGKTPWQSAAQEAFEEAGVEGIVEDVPIGTYRTIKKGGLARQIVEVDLYPLRVTQQHEEWAEKGKRHRHWVLVREARRLLNDPALGDLTLKLSRHLLAKHQRGMARISQ